MRDMIDDATRDDLMRVAHLLADAARVATLAHFRLNIAADNKALSGLSGARFDPVTEADRASEAAMRAILAAERPDDGILGEEFGTTAGTSGLTWVLDPIDGTRGYISGTPTWGVLISVADATGPLYGIIDQPYIRERFEGGFGRAAVNGPSGVATLQVRPGADLAGATLLSTFPEVGTSDEYRAFRRVADAVRLVRYGMDCYGYALLAAGQVDLVIEAGLQAYDVQAPIAVIQAAGGIVTDWQGRPAHEGGQIIAAATADLHRAALGLLNA